MIGRRMGLVAAAVALAACSSPKYAGYVPAGSRATLPAQSARTSNARPIGDYLAVTSGDDAQARASALRASLPLWTRTYSYKGVTYTYTMVGTDPARGSAVTTVPVLVVPFKFTMPDGSVFDPTMPTQTLKIS